ncbi:hypothetical protein A2U01_0084376, partial [Trifolium medium]|nr:hypothetical protein [Trifolium medium]
TGFQLAVPMRSRQLVILLAVPLRRPQPSSSRHAAATVIL